MASVAELKTVLQSITVEAKNIYGEKLSSIILFGSYARGDNTDESDIDIMILLDCDKQEVDSFREETRNMADDISLDSDFFVSILLRDKKNFEDKQDFLPFYKNVVREGVKIYGR